MSQLGNVDVLTTIRSDCRELGNEGGYENCRRRQWEGENAQQWMFTIWRVNARTAQPSLVAVVLDCHK